MHAGRERSVYQHRSRPITMRAFLVLAIAIAGAFACNAPARAFAEFCPAAVIARTPGSAPSTSFAYQLEARTPRSVDATMIADTDRGWFGWRVLNVPLSAIEKAAFSGDL